MSAFPYAVLWIFGKRRVAQTLWRYSHLPIHAKLIMPPDRPYCTSKVNSPIYTIVAYLHHGCPCSFALSMWTPCENTWMASSTQVSYDTIQQGKLLHDGGVKTHGTIQQGRLLQHGGVEKARVVNIPCLRGYQEAWSFHPKLAGDSVPIKIATESGLTLIPQQMAFAI